MSTSCEQARAWIHPYVDGEIAPADHIALEAHLLDCKSCRAEYESVRHVVDTLRGATPLYPVSASLPLKVKAILDGDGTARRKRGSRRVTIMAASFAATILLFALAPTLRTQRFTSFAASTHSQYAQGELPLGIASDEPGEISAWLWTHLPFHLSLPNFPSQPGEPKSYSLVGARLMQFDGQEVAYLAYTMDSRPISLLVTASASVVPSGGDAYTSGNLVFHFSSEKGLKLITWRDRGLTYALVSDLQVEGAQSCVVCHGSQSERQKFENLLRLDSLQ
jgi:anti-sigma factor RsiW